MDTQEKELNFGNDTEIQDKHIPKEEDIEVVLSEADSDMHHDTESHDHYDEHEEHEQKKKKKIRDPNKTKINQIMRDKFAAEERNRLLEERTMQLEQEMENLRHINAFSTQAAATNYETSTLDRLERAKELKAQALENHDIKAQIDADVALNTALNDYERLKSWKEEQRIYQQQRELEAQNYYNNPQNQQQQSYQQPAQQRSMEMKQHAYDSWHTENDWIYEDSPNYDPVLTQAAMYIAEKVELAARRNNRTEELYTPEYFDLLDETLDKWKREEGPKHYGQHQQRSRQMSSPRNIVSPVSNSGYRTTTVQNKQQVKLDPLEKDLADSLGVSYQEFARQKLIDREVQRQKYGQHNHRR